MWWWVAGAFLLGNETGRTGAEKKAALRDDEKLKALESMNKKLKALEARTEMPKRINLSERELLESSIKQHGEDFKRKKQQQIQSILQAEFASSKKQNYVSGNAFQLEKKLGFTHGAIFNELSTNWHKYFASTRFGNLETNGEFDGFLV